MCIVVAPPTAIGASITKYLTSKGDARREIFSLMILDNKATAPSHPRQYLWIYMRDSD